MQQMGMEGGADMENTAKTEERTWKDRIRRNLRPLLFGLLAGAGGALLLLVLFAAAMGAMHLTLAAIPWLARIIGAAGGFAAGFFAARSRKKRGLVIGGCAGCAKIIVSADCVNLSFGSSSSGYGVGTSTISPRIASSS